MKDTTFGFIGLGLIGGSIARGIKRACPTARIMAYMRTRKAGTGKRRRDCRCDP